MTIQRASCALSVQVQIEHHLENSLALLTTGIAGGDYLNSTPLIDSFELRTSSLCVYATWALMLYSLTAVLCAPNFFRPNLKSLVEKVSSTTPTIYFHLNKDLNASIQLNEKKCFKWKMKLFFISFLWHTHTQLFYQKGTFVRCAEKETPWKLRRRNATFF